MALAATAKLAMRREENRTASSHRPQTNTKLINGDFALHEYIIQVKNILALAVVLGTAVAGGYEVKHLLNSVGE